MEVSQNGRKITEQIRIILINVFNDIGRLYVVIHIKQNIDFYLNNCIIKNKVLLYINTPTLWHGCDNSRSQSR